MIEREEAAIMAGASATSAFAKWKQAIWNTYPKFSPTDTFKFSCHQGLKCFTQCCADVKIFLTPYDILRMKRARQMTSEEFLANYTETITPDGRGFPAVLLKMR